MEKLSKKSDVEIRIQVKEFKGKAYVDIREWSIWEGQDTFKPSKKGVTIPLDKWNEFASMITNIDTSKIEPEEDIQ